MLVEIDDSGRCRPHLKSALSLRFRRWLWTRGPPPPWDDGVPIRAELFSVERLEEHARSLANAQAVMPDHVKGPSLTTRLADNEAVLLAAYRDVAKACALPCRRFTLLLTKTGARLGADVDR